VDPLLGDEHEEHVEEAQAVEGGKEQPPVKGYQAL